VVSPVLDSSNDMALMEIGRLSLSPTMPRGGSTSREEAARVVTEPTAMLGFPSRLPRTENPKEPATAAVDARYPGRLFASNTRHDAIGFCVAFVTRVPRPSDAHVTGGARTRMVAFPK
tara:strand:+ start:937 stop:1290 length:354 start_codon:yes stop_codon:yes gene_type:complete